MDRKELKKRMKDPRVKKKVLDDKKIKRIIKDTIKNGGNYSYPESSINLVLCMEEMAECSQELSKFVRGKGDKQHLTEEIADVLNCLEYAKGITGIKNEDINKVRAVKMLRQEERNKRFKGGKGNEF